MRHHATELQRSWRHPKKTGRREQGNTNNIGKVAIKGSLKVSASRVSSRLEQERV